MIDGARVFFAVVALATAGCAGSPERAAAPSPPPAAGTAPGAEERDVTVGSPRGEENRSGTESGSTPAAPGDPGSGSLPAGRLDATRVDPNGPVGSYARVLLHPDLSQSIRLQVVTQGDAAPTRETLTALQQTLTGLTGKPVILPEPVVVDSAGDEAWTSARIRQLAGPSPTTPAGQASIRLAFLAGRFAEDDSALGVAVSATAAAVFTEQVRDAAGLLGDAPRLELAVATHEVGHILGLVDLVLHTGREDPAHPGHSRNRDSVMYWAVETDLVTTFLAGGPPTTFDDQDRADLAAIRAQEPSRGG